MFTAEQLAAATSQDSAVLVTDYPYGFRLRCEMRVWVEFKKGKGFRYCTQTSNPKRPGTWNKPKAGTYSKVSMVIGQDDRGHLYPAALSEFSALPEYAAFWDAHHAALSPAARGSFDYYREVKEAYENAQREEGVTNIYEATPEQRTTIAKAWMAVCIAHQKAGTAY